MKKECRLCGKVRHSQAMSSACKNTCVTCMKTMRAASSLDGPMRETKCMKCSKEFISPYKHGICELCKTHEIYKYGDTGYAIGC